jgi:hypothetical protein
MSTIEEFINKYGTETPRLLIGALIRRAPESSGDKELVSEIGRMMADLTSVLNAYRPVKRG